MSDSNRGPLRVGAGSLSIPIIDLYTCLLALAIAVVLGIEAMAPTKATVLTTWVEVVLFILLVIECSWRFVTEIVRIHRVGNTIWFRRRKQIPVRQIFWWVVDVLIIVGCVLWMAGVAVPDLHELAILRITRVIMIGRVLGVGNMGDFLGTILHSLRSVTYAIAVLLVHFYIYAITGTFLFGRDSPEQFRDLPTSAVTLLGISSGENVIKAYDTLKRRAYWSLSEGGPASHGTPGTPTTPADTTAAKPAADSLSAAMAVLKPGAEERSLPPHYEQRLSVKVVYGGFLYLISFLVVGVVLLLGIVTAMITNDIWEERHVTNWFKGRKEKPKPRIRRTVWQRRPPRR